MTLGRQLFSENDSKIEYLTFEFLFEDKIDSIMQQFELHDKKLVFLYKIKNGITKSSFAINIAKQVGLPEKITQRANQLLNILEQNLDNDEDILNEIKKPDEKFYLLRTSESDNNFNK